MEPKTDPNPAGNSFHGLLLVLFILNKSDSGSSCRWTDTNSADEILIATVHLSEQ